MLLLGFTDLDTVFCYRLVLMGKLLDDGNTLYKKQRLRESAQRFQYALKKFPPVEDFGGAEYRRWLTRKVFEKTPLKNYENQ